MKLLVMVFGAMLLLASCGDQPAASKPVAKVSKDFPGLFVENIDGAVQITEARKLKAGDKVVVTGKVMGADEVFVEGRAFVLLGDPAILKSCDTIEDDGCETPWDVCCDSDKAKKAGTLSVQVVDKDGKIMKIGLKGQAGLKELSMITVKGTVSADSSADVMTVNAESISIK